MIVWELRKEQGNGTAAYVYDGELVHNIEGLRPRGLDLDRMTSEGGATRLPESDGLYVLTDKGFDSFIADAEQQGKPEIVEILKGKRTYYWFRPPDLIRPDPASHDK